MTLQDGHHSKDPPIQTDQGWGQDVGGLEPAARLFQCVWRGFDRQQQHVMQRVMIRREGKPELSLVWA